MPNYSGAKLITGNNIPVVGNGMVLGLINGHQNGGLASRNDNISGVIFTHTTSQTGKYGTNASPEVTNVTITGMVGTLGVTPDGSKSGMIADISNFQNALYCIRY